jgi:hypothetical protein
VVPVSVDGLAIDVTGCTVEPAWPSGIAVVERGGRSVILDGSWEDIAEVGDAIAALARDGAA